MTKTPFFKKIKRRIELNSSKYALFFVLILVIFHSFVYVILSYRNLYSFVCSNDTCVAARHLSKISSGEFFYGFLPLKKYPFWNAMFIDFSPNHFNLILYFFIPFYLLYPNTMVLQFFQVIILSSGAIPVYLLAKKKLNSELVAIVFSISYLLSPLISNYIILDYHSSVLSLTFLLWSFYFIERINYRKSILSVIMTLFCQENLSVTIILLGIYTFIKRDKKLGIIVTSLGIFWFVFFILYLSPKVYYNYLENYGRYINFSPSQVSIKKVIELINNLGFDVTKKVKYLRTLLQPHAFLSILSPETLAIVSHEFILFLMFSNPSAAPGILDIRYHYSAIALAFIFISSIIGFRRLNIFLGKKVKFRYSLQFLILIVFLTTIISNNLFSEASIKYVIRELNMDFEITNHNLFLFQTIRKIPNNSSVVVATMICPHANHFERTIMFDNYYNNFNNPSFIDVKIDYMIFDLKKDSNLPPDVKVESAIQEITKDFDKIVNYDGILLYKHK